MDRVYFAHCQACTDGISHAESVVAHLRSEVGLEVVTWLNHEGVTPNTVAAFLQQFREPQRSAEPTGRRLEEPQRSPGCTKGTLVVVDAPALADPMGVLKVIHEHLPGVPLNIRFLVLMPLLPMACIYCPCHTHF